MTEAPTIGWFDGRVHHYPLRVYYEDTDYADLTTMPKGCIESR